MVEKRGRSSRRLSFKDFISQKRRFVTLTEKELSWQKIKEKDNSGEIEQKGVIPLSEITSVTQIQDSKTSFRVSTPQQEVNFQANNNGDMTEWMILLITRQRRHLFFHNRSNSVSKHNRQIDVEKELENLHTILMKHIEKIAEWKDQIEADVTDPDPSNADKFPHNILQNAKTPESRNQLKEALSSTLLTTLSAIQSIENVHQKALALAIQMQNLQNYKSDKLGIKGLTDNENYLLMHGRDRHLKSKDIQPISKHLA
uniref:PH domain-containing protein n=1 Tax=Panagrolaimus sp. JU765 TaxID=591449 RepID=A0AC34Q7X8_9BILA